MQGAFASVPCKAPDWRRLLLHGVNVKASSATDAFAPAVAAALNGASFLVPGKHASCVLIRSCTSSVQAAAVTAEAC
jgi:hypothetical protein